MPTRPDLRAARSKVFFAVVILFSAGTLSGAEVGRDERAEAQRIIEATGVKGGLVVHLGCGSGRLTAALCAGDNYLVHGLEADAGKVKEAREHVRSLGLYGRVTIEQRLSDKLPYADNLVNLFVAEDLGKIPMAEVMRVLVPNGTAYIKGQAGWVATVKPRPAEPDDWTHFLHDPDGNPVSQDGLVGPPRHIQWVAGPKWARSHEHLSSVSAVVSTGGRIFYIVDETPVASVAFPPRWFLVGRDAFNGVLLWKRPITAWAPHLHPFRAGPTQLPRTLVAVGDEVYVTLSLRGPVTVLDAATGKLLRTLAGTEGTEEILCHEGVLLLAAAPKGSDPAEKLVLAVVAENGNVLWKREAKRLLPLTLAARADKVFFKDGESVLCLDVKSGKTLWRSEPIRVPDIPQSWYAPTLVSWKGVVLFADGEVLAGLDSATGKQLWAEKSHLGYNSPPDVIVAGGLLWAGKQALARDPGITVARDPLTGKVKKEIQPDLAAQKIGMPHHRCYRDKATERHLLLGRAGIEFLDIESGKILMHHWVRGACQYGVLPANGLVYAPQHSCACYIKAKLSGFNALAPARETDGKGQRGTQAERLQRGPAYDEPVTSAAREGDWPTYRRDPARSGSTSSAVPAALKRAWQADLGGRLSSPVIAEGKVFVASIDEHTVYAVDADKGDVLWNCTVGGRVDSPPTVWNGLVLFGAADGWVYCLRAGDGAMVWRFRGAPEDRRVVAFEQVESAWPIHGNVLVLDGVAHFAAGRSSFLDGGIYLCRLDARTGKLLSETCVYSLDPKTGEQPPVQWFDMAGALPDVLSSDGEGVYMRHLKFNLAGQPEKDAGPHLFSSVGFLDDSWWHRTYFVYGDRFDSGWAGWFRAGNQLPSGRLLVADGSNVYGYGRKTYGNVLAPAGPDKWSGVEEYRLFATPKKPAPKADQASGPAARGEKKPAPQGVKCIWETALPFQPRAMVLAGKTIFAAGPAGDMYRSLEAFEGEKGVVLCAVSASDGAKLAEHKLESLPTFDGMAAAGRRLYLTLQNGRVVCLTGE